MEKIINLVCNCAKTLVNIVESLEFPKLSSHPALRRYNQQTSPRDWGNSEDVVWPPQNHYFLDKVLPWGDSFEHIQLLGKQKFQYYIMLFSTLNPLNPWPFWKEKFK